MDRLTSRYAVAVAATVALLVSACSDDGSKSDADDKTFEVVLNTGITGPRAAVAADILLGIETAAEQINEKGGIDGRQVKVTTLDSQGDPTKGVSEMQNYLSSGKKPDLVYAGINSTETLALLPLLSAQKVLSVSQTASAEINQPDTYPFHFGVSPTNLDSGLAFGPELTEAGVENLAAVIPSDAFGDDVERMLTEVTDAAGIELNVERFDVESVDYSASYQRALQSNPDGVYIDGAGEAAAGLFAARLKVGATDIPTWGGTAIANVAPSSLADAAALPNCKFIVYSFTAATDAPPEALAPLAEAVAGSESNIYVPGLGYDAMRVVAAAADEAGASDAESLQEALSELVVEPGYSVELPGGFQYSSDSHFPGAPQQGDQSFIPCTSTSTDGFWSAS